MEIINETDFLEKELKRRLKKEYLIKVNNNWFKRYLFLYAKCTPLDKITMLDALYVVSKDIKSFAYFIYGCRANYASERMQNQKTIIKNENK